ncbi:MAG: hypothetical protein A2593_01070 [Candidatus Moranbacteria bacterium RIFOXYD1_FULL_44_9]|nr:MAG: hypothetical protein A2593_01070 [Candidatus Moranbacteria bacterium RIFOXYD1_FULL_44_9]
MTKMALLRLLAWLGIATARKAAARKIVKKPFFSIFHSVFSKFLSKSCAEEEPLSFTKRQSIKSLNIYFVKSRKKIPKKSLLFQGFRI